MSFVYPVAARLLATGQLDLREAGADLRVALLKRKHLTSCDTETLVTTLSGFTTLGEVIATGYFRQPITSQDVQLLDRGAAMLADNPSWTLGGALNDIVGAALVYLHVTNDSDSIPVAYIDDNGADFNFVTIGAPIEFAIPPLAGLLEVVVV